MKPSVLLLLVALLLATAGPVLTGCSKAGTTSDAATQYTCPHHPEVVTNSPGTCPKCNMKLVEKK
jgi:hypothetical protein